MYRMSAQQQNMNRTASASCADASCCASFVLLVVRGAIAASIILFVLGGVIGMIIVLLLALLLGCTGRLEARWQKRLNGVYVTGRVPETSAGFCIYFHR